MTSTVASNPQLPTQYLTTKPATSTDPLQHCSLSPTGLPQGPSRRNIFMTSRGTSWWRGLRRIGARRAQVIYAWVMCHERTLANTYPVDLVAPPGQPKVVVELGKDGLLAPIDRLIAAAWLDGSEGANRDTRINYIGAGNDLEAINSYLHRFRDRPTHCVRTPKRSSASSSGAYSDLANRSPLFWCQTASDTRISCRRLVPAL
jgi:hypothetical protein